MIPPHPEGGIRLLQCSNGASGCSNWRGRCHPLTLSLSPEGRGDLTAPRSAPSPLGGEGWGEGGLARPLTCGAPLPCSSLGRVTQLSTAQILKFAFPHVRLCSSAHYIE